MDCFELCEIFMWVLVDCGCMISLIIFVFIVLFFMKNILKLFFVVVVLVVLIVMSVFVGVEVG